MFINYILIYMIIVFLMFYSNALNLQKKKYIYTRYILMFQFSDRNICFIFIFVKFFLIEISIYTLIFFNVSDSKIELKNAISSFVGL